MSTATRAISVAEYDRMIECGVFDPQRSERFELIHGVLQEMPPIGPTHEEVIDRIAAWSFRNTTEDAVRIRIQNSIGIPPLDSAPEPDVCWVKPTSYWNQRPLAEDVLLLIEVADSSLSFDLGEKAVLYAEAGVKDYWVISIPQWRVEVFRQPENGVYQQHLVYECQDSLSPLELPDVELSVSSLFEQRQQG